MLQIRLLISTLWVGLNRIFGVVLPQVRLETFDRPEPLLLRGEVRVTAKEIRTTYYKTVE